MTTEHAPSSALRENSDTSAWLAALTLEELEREPYPIFERLRAEAPLAYLPAAHSWVASTWELCQEIANDSVHFGGGTSPTHERVLGSGHILNSEGEHHADLRAAVDPPLRPRAFRPQLESQIRPAAQRLIATLDGASGTELMSSYFEPVSVRCVGDFLGFEEIDIETLRLWFHSMARGIANTGMDTQGNFTNPEGFQPADEAGEHIREHLAPKVERLTQSPDDSPLSHIIHAGRDGEPRTLDYLLPTIKVSFIGGLQEPGHLCGSAFLGLSTRPEQLARVAADKALIPAALNEGMRWLSPVFSASSRIATQDVTLAGATVHAGDTVWLSYGSANRDTSEFTDPAVYDLDRETHPHLGFGIGRHACSGSAYGPQIARIALEELFTAYPDVHLTTSPDQVPVWGWLFRGPMSLDVAW